MRQRVRNPNNDAYGNYGGRGLSICARWEKFENFLADMGECPPGMTIERKDNNGNYEPGNCKWASYTAQSRNRRYTKLTLALATEIRAAYSAGGVSQPQLARQYGVSQSHIQRIVTFTAWQP